MSPTWWSATRRRCWPRCSRRTPGAPGPGAPSSTWWCATGPAGLKIVFFNQPWRAKQLEAGTEAIFFGKVTEYRGTRQMANPVVDVVAGVTPGRRTLRILPVYPASAKAGLTSWEIGSCVEEALAARRRVRRPPARRVARLARVVGPHRGLRGHPPARVLRGQGRRPAGGWSSTSCSASSSPWCCGAGPSR